MNTESAIKLEDLGLYPYKEFKAGKRKLEECMPEHLEVGNIYPFLKAGHRNYTLGSTVTLLELTTSDVLYDMRARASIETLDGFVILDNQSYTKGQYKVEEILAS